MHPNNDDIGGTLPSEDQRRVLLPSSAHTDRLHPSSSLIRSSRTWIWTYGYKVSEREDLESWKSQTDDRGSWLATRNEVLDRPSLEGTGGSPLTFGGVQSLEIGKHSPGS
ncbi:hypothetical protein PM082_011597 [Marasmius tenuissimus]|nr:hypothetical protein PM082_011597 [Marasmius tenuissimus]